MDDDQNLTFDFVALDVILDEHGTWRVIELNSRPIGVAAADRLAAGCGSPRFKTTIGDALAQVYAKRFRSSLTGFGVLSDRYVVRTGSFQQGEICAAAAIPFSFANAVLMDINLLRKLLRERHSRTLTVVDREALRRMSERDAPIVMSRNLSVGADGRANADLIKHLVCRDKLATSKFVSGFGAGWDVDTYPLVASEMERCLRINSDCHYFTVKPRFGSGSVGVQRISKDTLEALCVCRNKLQAFVGMAGWYEMADQWIVQPWVRSSRSENKWMDRQCDIRVYAVGGVAVGGVVRRSAASQTDLTAESELVWLTTLGDCAPLAFGDAPCLTWLGVTKHQIRALDGLCYAVGSARVTTECLRRMRASTAEALDEDVSATDRVECGIQ